MNIIQNSGLDPFTAPGQTTVAGSVFVAKNPETFGYDADGNMTNDGRWTYTWDGENRLVNMTSLTNTPTASQYKLDFMYDYMGRRIQKIVSTTTNSGTNYAAQYTNRFIYDRWNPLAILNPASALVASFVWGLDLSGSMQGAGGVGALLTENIVSNGVYFVAYDGNGNVTALVNAGSGTVSANYEYGPFGEVIRITGTSGKANPIRFSSKYTDDESGLVYYGYRYYNPSTERWLSRDPICELGFRKISGMPKPSRATEANYYAFTKNDPIDGYDINGLLAGGTCALGTVTETLAEGATAEEIAEATAIALAATPVEAVVLSVAVTAGAVVVTYKVCHAVCDELFCSDRHPSWATCPKTGTDDPSTAVSTQAPTVKGWSGPYVDTVYPDGVAKKSPGGAPGSRYNVGVNYIRQLPNGTFERWEMSLSVNCCKCCNTFSSGTSCQVVHPKRGAGGQQYPDPVN